MVQPFRIGLIGCGTVGTGVLELLRRRADDLARVAGRPFEVRRVVVRDPGRPRNHLEGLLGPDLVLSGDPASVTEADDLDVVVELAGGTAEPRDWMLAALRQGHDVVTANKAALAFHGEEIFGAARDAGRSVYYEASVAAAIPIVEVLQSGLVANRITRLYGILNGTCNYVLTKMERDRVDYASALAEAQRKGFAEADPALDVSGDDTAHKLALLAGLVTHSFVEIGSIPTEGIEEITREDIEFAAEFGYSIKLLAIAKCTDDRAWDLRVHPAMIPRRDILAQVQDEFNAVELRGNAAGPMLLYGKGAGALPTASSVVADILRAAKGEQYRPNSRGLGPPRRVEIGRVALRNYIRMTVLDAPGVLGRITSFLGMRDISIASIRQPEASSGQPVPIVVVTHRTEDRVISEALRELADVGVLTQAATRIRIED